ncbi:MAG: hypothetical protein M1818_004293 [Claussenomyces sp. TS43310]|nr:MAG: hypothetical protein M1818_004293 [Claussenomyces sp. TS43310]
MQGQSSSASSKSSASPHSRTPSVLSQNIQQHLPITPSGLREAHTLSQSPETKAEMKTNETSTTLRRTMPSNLQDDVQPMQAASGTWSISARNHSLDGTEDNGDKDEDESTRLLASVDNRLRDVATETTALLRRPLEYAQACVHPGPCNHGTFSPQPISRNQSFLSMSGSGSMGPRGIFGNIMEGITGGNDSTGGSNGKKRSATARLAEAHGIKNSRIMYITYYIPFFAWIKQYRWAYLQGDLISALTMASFYIPMALSYASNLGHIPPINGLYSFVFNPIIYAVFGSCPQMVVGPEAAGSLLVGSVVRDSVDKGKIGDDDGLMNGRVAGVVTGMAGAVIFVAGLTRLGFLDSVLSRPFMRGFISSVGFIIIIDQLLTEMGLSKIAEAAGVSHGSSIDKIGFLFQHWRMSHGLTCIVAGASFIVIMVCSATWTSQILTRSRELKRRLQPRYPRVAYLPDRFLVVVLSAVFTWKFGWESEGLKILGEVKSISSGNPFPFHWPFRNSHMKHVREAMGTSFLIALLGFFESSVAAKALGGGEGRAGDGIQGIQLSANRELVALGVANLVGGCFMALPAFGGYGRSKVNASTGGKTPMSSVFLSLFTVLCVLFLLPYFYYIPKAVLSSMITVVAWTLIEEAPHDIAFFVRIRGYTELGLMVIIFAATIFYSLTLGIAIGVGLSFLSVIKHATRPRIQILGRIPGTNRFENAERDAEALEFTEGCLIVKIPEPLTFANTGDLKNRLRRLELYGTLTAHPALPRVRPPELNRNVIFDIHGVTGLDGSGTQVMAEIVQSYRSRGVRVFFSRGPAKDTPIWKLFARSGILDAVGGPRHFVRDVDEALRLTETEELDDERVYGNLAGNEGEGA